MKRSIILFCLAFVSLFIARGQAPQPIPATEGARAPGPDGDTAANSPLPAALAGQKLSIVVGDPELGKRFFNGPLGKCSACHAVADGQSSPAANLAHIATKYPDAKTLQNNLVINRGIGWSPRNSKDIKATIAFKDGRKVEGYLTSVSDFKVVVRDNAGKETEFARNDGEPSVKLTDRLQAHLDLLSVLQDDDIHNLTAYLATLK